MGVRRSGITAFVVLLLTSIAPVAHLRADDIAKGAELAKALCAECHLNPGQGEKRGPMGVPGFTAVANRPLQTVEGVVGWLRSVPPMMPNHRLTQDEIDALAAYIMSLRD
ncbi:MAG TPA: cytochrome c [Hyphomicrobium sp.]|nr:cytochrome c [Hyphomicrobium sp.]